MFQRLHLTRHEVTQGCLMKSLVTKHEVTVTFILFTSSQFICHALIILELNYISIENGLFKPRIICRFK